MNPNTILILGPHDEYLLVDTLDNKKEIIKLIHELEEQCSNEGTSLDMGTFEDALNERFPDIKYMYLDIEEDIFGIM